MKKRGKKYIEILSKIDKTKVYNLDEALKIILENKQEKFDSTIEIIFKLNLEAKKADQQLRGAVILPKGTGKTKKILVVTKKDQQGAKEAGADYVGDIDLIEKITKEQWFDFDVIVATPEMMPELGKIGQVLGPKGLMPNPKTGTVTTDVKKTVEEIKKGTVNYKSDTFGNVHMMIGKSSFPKESLKENFKAIYEEIKKVKPTSLKGTYIKNISISSTMSPSIKLDLNSF